MTEKGEVLLRNISPEVFFDAQCEKLTQVSRFNYIQGAVGQSGHSLHSKTCTDSTKENEDAFKMPHERHLT